mgnify:CR=1 FL=1
MPIINSQVKPFKATAFKNGSFVDVSDADLAERKTRWVRPESKYKRGVLAKYAKTVSSASEGAVTDKYL